MSGPKFFGDIEDTEELPTPEESRNAGVELEAARERDQAAQKATRKRLSKTRRQKMRVVGWNELEGELQKVDAEVEKRPSGIDEPSMPAPVEADVVDLCFCARCV